MVDDSIYGETRGDPVNPRLWPCDPVLHCTESCRIVPKVGVYGVSPCGKNTFVQSRGDPVHPRLRPCESVMNCAEGGGLRGDPVTKAGVYGVSPYRRWGFTGPPRTRTPTHQTYPCFVDEIDFSPGLP